MSHHCHANDCPTPTPRKYLMRPRHWNMVPGRLAAKVYHEYFAAGGSTGPISNLAHTGYWGAAADAVESVARQEGKSEANDYRRIWLQQCEDRLLTEIEDLTCEIIVRALLGWERRMEAYREQRRLWSTLRTTEPMALPMAALRIPR